jgi:hexosaminidase
MLKYCLLPMPRRLGYTTGQCPLTVLNAEPAVNLAPAQISHTEGYELHITPTAVQIIAHDPAGVFYARQTLQQIRQQAQPDGVPCARIVDWPDYAHRGVMLDISRDKVPTMATLKGLVDLLASWKINQLQLYTEHTFAFTGHETVWKNASPMTATEIRELDAYCRDRHMELVPNQNSFGHLHRWFMHPEYKHLAETPAGVTYPWSGEFGDPFSLCPTAPESLTFLGSLYDELLPNFSSAHFNVGCDETFDIDKGRSAAACAQLGKGRVYLNFLKEIHTLVSARGKRMMFWADIMHEHPELVPELPKDAIALEWRYWEFDPFMQRCERFAQAGVPFYVCPGTSTWNTVVGNTTNGVNNIRGMARVGLTFGALGLLNTDWGDGGHHQPLPVSYIGYACGAACSWCYETNQVVDYPQAVDRFAFRDRAGVLGKLAWDLGNTYLHGGNSPLWGQIQEILYPKTDHRFKGVTLEGLHAAKAHIQDVMQKLPNARPQGPDAALLIAEYECAAALLTHAINLGIARWSHEAQQVQDMPVAVRRALAEELKPLIAQHRAVWLARNRPGGLTESVGRLTRALQLYEAV